MMKPESVGAGNPEQSLVFFDLETTGLGNDKSVTFLLLVENEKNFKNELTVKLALPTGQNCEIVQLAAVSGSHSLNLYVIPPCRMQRGAAKVTGFRVRRQRLYLHRQLVPTNSLREVLVSFIAFLQMLGRPLLIGHNSRRFDCPLLLRALDQLDLREQFEASISGCVDTLPLAREVLKDRCLQSFRQENLVRELLGVNYKAHDALEDVRALQSLYSVLQPIPEVIWRHMFTLDTTDNKSAMTAPKVPNKLSGQRPLWENFRQAVKITEGRNGELHE